MSILIKGMEMPKACYDCPCEYDGWCHATEILDEDGEWIHPTINDPYTKRQEWCPLIELPPHGRLIDADALMEKVEHDTPLSTVFEKTMRFYLKNAPTIIEADSTQSNNSNALDALGSEGEDG